MKTSFFRILSPALLGLLASLSLAPDTQARVFVATNSTWHYFKGTSEASTPTNAWRELDFDDSAWLVGAAPFHYGTNALGGDDTLTGGTILSDMRSNYTCIFLRQRFELPDTNNIRGLWLNAWFDDGLAIWINGQAARAPILVGRLAYTNTATTSHEGSTRNAVSLADAVPRRCRRRRRRPRASPRRRAPSRCPRCPGGTRARGRGPGRAGASRG